MAQEMSMKRKTRLPPHRSAAIPVNSRQMAPLRMTTETSHESWMSVSPNSVRIGMPRTQTSSTPRT